MTASPEKDQRFPQAVKMGSNNLRLDYLDGIRALAALYVSFFHVTLIATWTGVYGRFPVLSPFMSKGINLFLFGHFGVSVFIILSGYCLMLPVVRSHKGQLPGGTRAFLRRRARRILPPYYVALTLALLLALVPGMNRPNGSRWDQALPAWEPGAILSHFLLIQNWNSEWLFKIDMPAWSVAPEWQIYWLFPYALLPLARRIGMVGTVLFVVGLGWAARFVFGGRYDFIAYSYVGLFALGMMGAAINFSKATWAQAALQRFPWGLMTWLGGVSFVFIGFWRGWYWMEAHCWVTDLVIGFATVCLLVFCTQHLVGSASKTPPFILRLLQAKSLVLLGGFSYSYYLMHDLILNALCATARLVDPEPQTLWCFLFGAGIPLSLTGAYAFHRLFERPFMPARPLDAEQAARVASLSPAP